MNPSAVTPAPVIVKVTLENIFHLSIEQLKDELTKLGQDI